MKTISLHTLKHTLRDIHVNTENRKFCFVLGAGASYTSGIPTGGQLAKKWFAEIEERYSPRELEEWIKEEKIEKDQIAAHYGAIYRKRFESDKTSGYEFLVQAMRTAKPTFGHMVLAQILTKAPGNCVLTTNFDNLIESSIYQYTNRTPLVCGHESLSGYARPSKIHPLIVKIHRDLLLSPKSDPDEISALDHGWKGPLDNIFSSHIPIVIGYGGNDGSLMNYFEKMNLPSNFFWCGHKGSKPTTRIEHLVEKMNGSYIEIDGFDEMMHELLWVFDEIKPIKEELESITKSRIEAMNTQLNKIIENSTLTQSDEGKSQKELSAFEYAAKAENEPDFEKRKAIYLEALEKFPDTPWLWNDFTYFLQFTKKDFDNLEDYYLQALLVDPENGNNNGNYAIFLKDIKKDFDKAEKYYLKAISIESEDADFNGNYAIFLSDTKKDFDKAEKYYLKAISIEPEDADFNGNYAVFLEGIRKDFDKAEKYYLKALSIEPEDADFNGNYASFLADIKKDFDKAEKHFLKALSIEPEDADFNGNYANFLADIRKDFDKAEKHFLKALSIEPENANFNGNYAISLKDSKKGLDKAEKYYLKALSIESEDADFNGNYASLLFIFNRTDEATKYLEKAFELNNEEKVGILIELWFYKYAHIQESLEESEAKIESLLNEGIRAIGWNLDDNVETAIKNGHPHPQKLKELADRITKEEVYI